MRALQRRPSTKGTSDTSIVASYPRVSGTIAMSPSMRIARAISTRHHVCDRAARAVAGEVVRLLFDQRALCGAEVGLHGFDPCAVPVILAGFRNPDLVERVER